MTYGIIIRLQSHLQGIACVRMCTIQYIEWCRLSRSAGGRATSTSIVHFDLVDLQDYGETEMLSPKNVKRSIFGHKKSHRERDAERIEELGRELGSFKMQVQTTEELNKALNQENELLRLRFEKIDAELEEMRAKVMDVESRNRDLERTVNAAQEELEEFENYKSAIEKEVSEKKENTLTMILDLESKLKKKEVEVEEMKKSQESVQNSKKDLRLTLKKLANSVNNLKEHEKDLKPKEISHMKIEIFLELDEILKSYRDWMH